MKENSPICARLAAIVSAVSTGCRNGQHDHVGDATDLPTTMMNTVASTASGSRTRIVGSNSMPTETKNSTAKASRSGSVSSAACWLSSRFAQHHAGEERAQRERDVEQLGGAVGDAERDRQHGEAEQLARAGMGDVVQHPRDDAAADHQHQRDEGGDLAERQASGTDDLRHAMRVVRRRPRRRRTAPASAGSSTSASTIARSSTISQPTAMRPALGLEQAALLQRAQQHDRAGDRQRQAEHEAGAQRSSRAARPSPMPSSVATDHPAERARDGDGLHRQQVLEREMQADAEHQQDHADLGELGGQRWSATKPGVYGPTTTPASR